MHGWYTTTTKKHYQAGKKSQYPNHRHRSNDIIGKL